MSGFKNFILRGNLVDLAVAVVIGAQFSSLVKQFVASFISPLLGLFGGHGNFSNLAFTLDHGKARFTYGAFLTEAISFLISCVVVYFLVVLPVSRMLKLFQRNHAATERPCPRCTLSIPVAARRCPPLPAVHGGHRPRHRAAPVGHDAAPLSMIPVSRHHPWQTVARSSERLAEHPDQAVLAAVALRLPPRPRARVPARRFSLAGNAGHDPRWARR
jgi:large conductance mechanosensitive channel